MATIPPPIHQNTITVITKRTKNNNYNKDNMKRNNNKNKHRNIFNQSTAVIKGKVAIKTGHCRFALAAFRLKREV